MRGSRFSRAYFSAMKTILVPIDFSFITERTVDTACTLARATNSAVCFLHVIQENMYFDGMGIPVPSTRDDGDAMAFEARRALNEYVGVATSTGLTATAFVMRGHPPTRILEKAAEVKPEFIVLGSHGHGSLHGFLVGSSAQGVLKRAECPVVIVPTTLVATSEVSAGRSVEAHPRN